MPLLVISSNLGSISHRFRGQTAADRDIDTIDSL